MAIFECTAEIWYGSIKERQQKGTEMNNMLEEVLEMRVDSKDLAFNEDLQKIIDFQTYMNNGMQEVTIQHKILEV